MDYLKNLAKDSKSTPTTTTTTSSSSPATQIPDAFADDVAKLTGVSAEQVKTVGGKVVEQYEKKGRLTQHDNDDDEVLKEEDEKASSKTKQSGTAAGDIEAKNSAAGNQLAGKTDPASSRGDVDRLGDNDTRATKASGGGVKTGRLGDHDDGDDDLVQQVQKGTISAGSGFASGVKTRGTKNSQGQGTSTLDPTTGDFQSQSGNISQDY